MPFTDDDLTRQIIGCAYQVHNTLGSGFLEKVYENAMCIVLEKQGLQVIQQAPIKVEFEGQVVGDYFADLLIEDAIIVELKAIRQINREHEVQLVNYLTATKIEIGLLINFGPSVQVKRKHRIFKETQR